MKKLGADELFSLCEDFIKNADKSISLKRYFSLRGQWAMRKFAKAEKRFEERAEKLMKKAESLEARLPSFDTLRDFNLSSMFTLWNCYRVHKKMEKCWAELLEQAGKSLRVLVPKSDLLGHVPEVLRGNKVAAKDLRKKGFSTFADLCELSAT